MTMYVTLSDHVREQLQKRKPDKTPEWLEGLFKGTVRAFLNKETYKGFPVYQNRDFGKYGACYKISCGKYAFVYCKPGYSEYTIITFLTREDQVKTGGKTYYLNCNK